MGVTFEVDHIAPRSMGGAPVLENLCLCCPMCNRHKATRTRMADPLTLAMTRLFHPGLDTWEDHFEWSERGSRVVGRTPVGRATVEALRMNRRQMVELRRYWVETGRHPPQIEDG
jgi:hypothetical protein